MSPLAARLLLPLLVGAAVTALFFLG